ncbi:AraC family transcriptional regulator [Dyella tabacisoli]|uniref:AraC family transcriptional regulator n=1 Tax=Dyella tabacisoli TaxID=2282381 RepID=A0A369UP95_9GAMM|nr:AraC family transcriptional regulator [Dyella tabacisoli]RDD81865.1 AraC family transcriptional regulator [Dyella tabacisoli]
MSMQISADELEALFDALPDVVFFVKDIEGRYTHANLTLVRRLGLKQRSQVIGHTVTELFPDAMGGSYASQDRRVLEGEVIENQLEVHIFSNRTPGWCLTCKRPLRVRNDIRGVIGISRDLGKPDGRHPTYVRLRRVLAYLQEHYAQSVRVRTLAELADVSVAQLERHFRRVFQLTPQQVQTKLRIEAAMRLLHGDDSVAAIGLACGFADQSAFARQFKATVGMTPRDYRGMVSVP